MDKLTRTDFSFNTREGACPTCEGLGQVHAVDRERVVDEAQSLEEGAVSFWVHRYRDYQIGVLQAAAGLVKAGLLPWPLAVDRNQAQVAAQMPGQKGPRGPQPDDGDVVPVHGSVPSPPLHAGAAAAAQCAGPSRRQ